MRHIRFTVQFGCDKIVFKEFHSNEYSDYFLDLLNQEKNAENLFLMRRAHLTFMKLLRNQYHNTLLT